MINNFFFLLLFYFSRNSLVSLFICFTCAISIRTKEQNKKCKALKNDSGKWKLKIKTLWKYTRTAKRWWKKKKFVFRVRNGVKEYSHNEFRYTHSGEIFPLNIIHFEGEGCECMSDRCPMEITNVLRNFFFFPLAYC